MTPDPEKVREIAREAADLDYCSHADYPIQVTLTLLDGDVDVKHDQCGRIVQTDWPYLRADHVPLELVHATDGNEDWLELRLRSDEQPKAKPTRLPLPDRLDLIAQHLAPATEELRGLHGASHARLLVAAAIGSLRWVVDDLRGEKRPDEQPQDEGDGESSAAVRVRAFCDRWAQIQPAGHEVIDRFPGVNNKLTEPDVRALLDNREAWRNLALSRGAKQAERDADVRAVARLLRDFRHNYPGLTSLKAMTRLEERFADRIAELREREGGEKP